VHAGAAREGLASVTLTGRFTVLPGRPATVLDVAHNPHAAKALADTLGAMGFFPRTFAVFAMLKDKDIGGVVDAMRERVERWYVAGLPGPRGGTAGTLRERLIGAGVQAGEIVACEDVEHAWHAARAAASDADRIVVFGSFLTVAAVLSMTESGRTTRSAT
jgi:dihydrofolate synthase/folylpolyglutamate synthase